MARDTRARDARDIKYFHKDKTEFVLDFLGNVVSLTGEIMSAFFDSYPSRRFDRYSKKGSDSHRRDTPSSEEQQRFYNILSRLQRDGLVAKRESGGRQSGWALTKRGLAKLLVFREKKKFSPSRISYEPKKDSIIRVVIFDVPERERHKRVWLRSALLALQFSMCQQSVWIGKRKIPENFLEDLRDREMISYVQIFEINKQGSLEQVA
ncbi:MAG: hypothetical protein Q8R20_03265 [Nanoarchaeota archaeon]|nr:hypothetical protein [Nanoarchaeota archaeon]